MSGIPSASFDLPASDYPFRIEFRPVGAGADTEPVHVITVDGPGVLQVPPLRTALGSPVWVRLVFASGRIDGEPV